MIFDGKTSLPRSLKIFSADMASKTYLASTLVGSNQYSINEVLIALGRQDVTSVLLEGGGNTLSRFFQDDLVDEIHCFIAPILIGGCTAPNPFMLAGVDTVAQANKYHLTNVIQREDDVQMIYQKKQDNHGSC